MKRIFLYLGAFALLLTATVLLTSSADGNTAAADQLSATDLCELASLDLYAAELAASTAYYRYPTTTSGSSAFVGDTITNATNDTVEIPVNLLTDRNWAWTIVATNISGTTAVIATVEEASTTGTQAAAIDWDVIGRDTFSATGQDWIRGEHTTGFKQRLILDGSGTQSTRIRSAFVAKPN